MYQGKYHDRASEKRRGPVGTVIFYTLYFVMIAAFAVGMHFVLGALEDWLVSYEASQPKVKSQQVFDQLFAAPDWAELYTMAGCEDTLYEGKDDYAAYMAQQTEGLELSFLETSAGIDQTIKKYNVKAGTEKVAAFTLTDATGGAGEVPDWQLSGVEVFFTRQESCTVLAAPDCTVLINGVALDDSHIIRTVSTAAESYLPEGVHGYRMMELYIDGLLVAPEVTVLDETGTEVDLVYDEAAGTYSCDLPASMPGDAEYHTLLTAAQTYCKYMIGAVGKPELQSCFDSSSRIYSTIVSNDTWMQSYAGYDFGTEAITEYYRYSDSLCSARVALTLNVTRKDGTVKQYELNTTFFLTEAESGWLVTDMTNVDIQQQTTMVRLTYMNGTEEVESLMVDANSTALTPPAVTAPDEQSFSGWFYETLAEDGSKTMTLAFLPDENGTVSLGGTTLEPMTLYALFESEGE